MYGAMGKQGGGIGQPYGGGATTNPVGAPSGGYGDYMNRRNAWIDQLRGYVAQPQPIGTGGGGGPKPQPKDGTGGIDHMANLRTLMGEDPRLANEYRLRNGDTINWWQQNQGNVAQGLFGGDNGKMQEWLAHDAHVEQRRAPVAAGDDAAEPDGGHPWSFVDEVAIWPDCSDWMRTRAWGC